MVSSENIDKPHTTEMGIERIKRNRQIEMDDAVQWSKGRIFYSIFISF
nr:DUF3781 domain-containing protein [uncultured Oscillibacter sp.]